MSKKLTLSEMLANLGDARQKRIAIYESYVAARDKENRLRYELEFMLKEMNLSSAKGRDFMASFSHTPVIAIRDEGQVSAWLIEHPEVEPDLYFGLKLDGVKTLAKTILESTGEILPGTELEYQEKLSIRSNKTSQKGEK